jgi:hypothetical protein
LKVAWRHTSYSYNSEIVETLYAEIYWFIYRVFIVSLS